MNFYDKYLSLCVEKGETPTSAGLAMGFSRGTVSRWKNGSEPSDRNKIVIANYFGIPVSDLNEKEKAPSADEAVSPAKQELLRMIDEMDEQQLLKVTLLIKMAKELK